jgi:DNA-binding response OmpR family regulator
LTAKGRDEDIAKGLALGADAYITKTFSNAALVATVNKVLENKKEPSG